MIVIRYYSYLTEDEESKLFFSAPVPFDNYLEQTLLAYAVGAALYCPATKATIADDIVSHKHEGLTSMVIDLEDAIGDNQIEVAEQLLTMQFERLHSHVSTGKITRMDVPLLFIRVRSEDQLSRVIDKLEHNIELLTGFVLPKFTLDNGICYMNMISEYNRCKNPSFPVLYVMPILETSSVIYKEARIETLLSIKKLLDEHKDYVLNVRIGATDFSSLFGLRRSPDMTIYDIAPIRDCISDIINIFSRMDSPYVISGPVWEYFSNRERLLKPQLRQSPFEEMLGPTGRKLRSSLIMNHMDGLIQEVILDKENGLVGKTVIHPSHIKTVQSLYTVTKEEYADASSIIESNNGSKGVMKSEYANKMNEIKPHLNWARRIINRAKIYGVLHDQQQYISLLPEQEHSYV